MTTPGKPPPGVYHSRSRTTRNRLVLTAAGLALVLLGYLIGRLQGGSDSPAAAAPPLPTVSSEAPSPSVAPSAVPTTREPGGTDAYSTIQAEAASGQQGTQTQETEDAGGGQNVGWISSGDFLRFDDVEFGDTPASKIAVRIASDVGDDFVGRLEVRLDSPGNEPAATLTTGRTGGWQDWETRTVALDPITGRHTVFLTFSSDRGDEFVNLNYFAFAH